MNIGQLATKALLAGKGSKETLELVKRVFPDSETTMKGIYHYASKAGVKLGNRSNANETELAKVLAMLEGAAAPEKPKRARKPRAPKVVEVPEVVELTENAA